MKKELARVDIFVFCISTAIFTFLLIRRGIEDVYTSISMILMIIAFLSLPIILLKSYLDMIKNEEGDNNA